MSAPLPAWRRALVLATLMFAGEVIFSLPFHVARFFRPTVLAAFGIDNAALGDAYAVYGLAAMLSYFPGGLLADRFPPRRLMAFALIATAAGGLVFAGLPTGTELKLLYGWWGMTTILPFWAALMRATREWGGEFAQGRAFGALDAGRGLVAAALAAIAVGLLERQLMGGGATAAGLREVILFYAALTAAAALACMLLPADGRAPAPRAAPAGSLLARLASACRLPQLGAQAAIVVAAYCGYKGIDNYALYAVQVLGMDEIEAARFVAAGAWLRPVAALLAGMLADRARPSTSLAALFVLAALSCALAAAAGLPGLAAGLLAANLALSMAAVYGLRGVYFALLAEAGVPGPRTGTAVGIISVVGYTPDVFFAPLAGRLLDAAPGAAGHRLYFLLLGLIALGGAAASLLLRRRLQRLGLPREIGRFIH
ncbi:MAG: MFS transporter [Gammaproteobacteria bacterium]